MFMPVDIYHNFIELSLLQLINVLYFFYKIELTRPLCPVIVLIIMFYEIDHILIVLSLLPLYI